MKKNFPRKKRLVSAAIIIICAYWLGGAAMANDRKALSSGKEWDLFDPRSQDPEVMPELNETSIDIAALSKLDSLKKIYKLASRMNPDSASDSVVLGSFVTDFITKKFQDYDDILVLLQGSGFINHRDITESATQTPEKYRFQKVEYDKVIYSEQKGRLTFQGILPVLATYKITVFFKGGKIVRANSYIKFDELF